MSKASNLATLQKLCSAVLLKLARQPVMSVLMRYYGKIRVFCHSLSFLKICALIRFTCSFAAPPTEWNCLPCKKTCAKPYSALLSKPFPLQMEWSASVNFAISLQEVVDLFVFQTKFFQLLQAM